VYWWLDAQRIFLKLVGRRVRNVVVIPIDVVMIMIIFIYFRRIGIRVELSENVPFVGETVVSTLSVGVPRSIIIHLPLTHFRSHSKVTCSVYGPVENSRTLG
jgi:hypothetical protein